MIWTEIGLQSLLIACIVALFAGLIKGIVGFALPTVMISGLSAVMSPELALAALIMPTVAANGWQAVRDGFAPAWQVIVRFRVFLLVGGVALVISAQLFTVLPSNVLFGLIGILVSFFALFQLSGWSPRGLTASTKVEATVAALAGFIGGMSGIWGPPTVAYLTAINTPKAQQVRVQGVIYGLGAVALLLAHLRSGVFNADTAQLSALMLIPALIGMWLGMAIQDRIDQRAFRTATLVVLIVAGLNLLRRAFL